MIVVTACGSSKRDEVYDVFVAWISGCIVFLVCLGSAGVLFVGGWAIARGFVLQFGLILTLRAVFGNAGLTIYMF
jgi:hypothetical protein